MSLKHKVTINVAKNGGIRDPVIKGGKRSIRSRILSWLFGEKVGVFVVRPVIRLKQSKSRRSKKEV